mmetsp:Transcript_82375/g.223209  ORF Transcript_82375/g.223209 Transcript_82375/m.223209 type:complete len:300 (-) Transcript_82375:85-984(-)
MEGLIAIERCRRHSAHKVHTVNAAINHIPPSTSTPAVRRSLLLDRTGDAPRPHAPHARQVHLTQPSPRGALEISGTAATRSSSPPLPRARRTGQAPPSKASAWPCRILCTSRVLRFSSASTRAISASGEHAPCGEAGAPGSEALPSAGARPCSSVGEAGEGHAHERGEPGTSGEPTPPAAICPRRAAWHLRRNSSSESAPGLLHCSPAGSLTLGAAAPAASAGHPPSSWSCLSSVLLISTVVHRVRGSGSGAAASSWARRLSGWHWKQRSWPHLWHLQRLVLSPPRWPQLDLPPHRLHE